MTRRELAAARLSEPAIVERVEKIALDGLGPDFVAAYELVEELGLVGPSLVHVRAILRGIAQSDPGADFGTPGPLVHYVERFSGEGYEPLLFETAASAPTLHFCLMLRRCANAGGPRAEQALSILRAYRSSALEIVRSEAARLLALTSGWRERDP